MIPSKLDEPPRQILLIILIILLLAGYIIFRPKPAPKIETTLNECFIYQTRTPYYPTPQTLGAVISEVIECESGWQHYKNGKIIKGKSGEIGICQFMPATWKMFNEERGTDLDIMDKEDQLDMIEWAFENNKQNHWTCYKEK